MLAQFRFWTIRITSSEPY